MFFGNKNQSFSQNTKGDRPAPAPRPLKENVGKKPAFKNSKPSSAGQLRSSKPNRVISTKNPFVNNSSQRPSSGDRASVSPRRVKTPSSASRSGEDSFSNSTPFVNNPSYKPATSDQPYRGRTASGRRLVTRQPENRSIHIYEWSGPKIRKAPPERSPSERAWTENRTASGQKLERREPQLQSRNIYTRRSSTFGNRVISTRPSDKVSLRPEVPIRTVRSSDGSRVTRTKLMAQSVSGTYMAPRKNNVYWGKFSPTHGQITTDMYGRSLRRKDYRSPLNVVFPKDTLPYIDRKTVRSSAAFAKSPGFKTATKSGIAWQGDISGKKLRAPSTDPRRTSYKMPLAFSSRSNFIKGNIRSNARFSAGSLNSFGKKSMANVNNLRRLNKKELSGGISGSSFRWNNQLTGAGQFRHGWKKTEKTSISTRRADVGSSRQLNLKNYGNPYVRSNLGKTGLIARGGSLRISPTKFVKGFRADVGSFRQLDLNKYGSKFGGSMGVEVPLGQIHRIPKPSFDVRYPVERRARMNVGGVLRQTVRTSPSIARRSAIAAGEFSGKMRLYSPSQSLLKKRSSESYSGIYKFSTGTIERYRYRIPGPVDERQVLKTGLIWPVQKFRGNENLLKSGDRLTFNPFRNPYVKHPDADSRALKKQRPNENVYAINGLQIKKSNEPTRPNINQTPLHFKVWTIDRSRVALTAGLTGKTLQGRYVHHPLSSPMALKVREPNQAFIRTALIQSNIKMRKPNTTKLHPDAQYAHLKNDNVENERSLFTSIKMVFDKKFKRNDLQPANVKEKVRRPRYDPREVGIWYD